MKTKNLCSVSILSMVLLLSSCFSLASCGNTSAKPSGSETPTPTINTDKASPDDYFEWEGDMIVGLTAKGEKATTIVIPKRATELRKLLFAGNENVQSIAFQNDDTKIGGLCFGDCSNLTSLELPANLQTIPIQMCSGCKSLATVRIPDSVTKIESFAFGYCESLERMEIPASVTEISDHAFANCSSLKAVKFNEGLLKIDHDAFLCCTVLEKVDLPESLQFIGQFAFIECNGIKEITVPGNVSTLEDGCFWTGNSETVIIVVEGSVADKAFAGLIDNGQTKKYK